VAVFVYFDQLTDLGVPRFSRKHVLDLQKKGKFPASRQITDNRVGWLEEEIIAWVASRPISAAVARHRDKVAAHNGAGLDANAATDDARKEPPVKNGPNHNPNRVSFRRGNGA
jgi:hypothetical protein